MNLAKMLIHIFTMMYGGDTPCKRIHNLLLANLNPISVSIVVIPDIRNQDMTTKLLSTQPHLSIGMGFIKGIEGVGMPRCGILPTLQGGEQIKVCRSSVVIHTVLHFDYLLTITTRVVQRSAEVMLTNSQPSRYWRV